MQPGLLQSPSRFIPAALKSPREAAPDAGQAVAEARRQAAGPRLMEAASPPPLLPACGPLLPFAEA